MQEYTNEERVDTEGCANVTDLLVRRVRSHPDHIAFDVAHGPAWRPVTTAAFHAEVMGVAKGLVAAGLRPGDRVALMAPTRYEWAIADFAIWFAGGVVVPIYETSSDEQVAARLADAQVRLGIGGSASHVEALTKGFQAGGLRTLGVWSMDARPGADLSELVLLGATIEDAEIEARRTRATLDDIATIVYTSGTSSAPKAAVITHGNFVGEVLAVAAAYTEVVNDRGNTVIFLPLAHVLARGLQLICLAKGMRIAHLSDPKQVISSLPVLRPTFLVVTPRVLQKIDAAAASAAQEKHLGALWEVVRRTGVEWGRFAEVRDAAVLGPTSGAAPRAPLGLRLQHGLFDTLFYTRLREKLGGRIDYLLSGAASLDAELSLFLRGAGIPVIEGYGLTETTAPITGHRSGAIRSGTVGVPIPGATVRIADDGEVLVKGVGVFPGYLHEADNRDAFTVDGFFRTADLGSLDEDGHLTLTGRVKDVIVTSGGKTVSPAVWEQAVESNPLVAHAVLVGEGKPYLNGLVLLDPDSVRDWASRRGIGDLGCLKPPLTGALSINDNRLADAITGVVKAANARLARSEQARRFAVLLADLSEAGGVVTPTMKLKRAAFTAGVADIVEGLYHGEGLPA